MRQITITPDDLDALARIVAAEARSEGPLGQTAVLDVILNRAAAGRGWPSSIQGVITQPGQFEPLRGRSSWRELPEADPAIRDNLANAIRARASGDRADTTSGATFFLNPTITNRRGTHFAASQQPTAVIGRHSFFNSTDRSPRPIPVPEHSLNLQLSAEASANSSAQTTPLAERTFAGFARHQDSLPGIAWNNVDRTQLDPSVADRLDRLQTNMPFPIEIRSGFRDPSRNAAVGGARNSEHTTGRAVDISLRGLDDEQRRLLVATATGPGMFNRVGAYSGNTGLHLDMRDQRLPDGTSWPMFDRSRANTPNAPSWFRQGLADGAALTTSTRENATLSASMDPEIARSLGLDRPPTRQTPQAPDAPSAPTAIASRTPRPTQPRVAANASGEPLSQSELSSAYPDALADPQVDTTYGRFSSLVTNENLNALFPQLTQRESTGIGIGLASL
ncbi:Peptidase M15A, C-terminal [uncultured Caudovirales phage]|uniref:Peptidase M15A, C-terminal n=1 Tax=uncultured Caudovirales phage TaxID=2100421 RepID=A0A6J5NJQ4_9CAUD|nr:Peptidase M15A, C-terminal [uncultured Caudovirales phage]